MSTDSGSVALLLRYIGKIQYEFLQMPVFEQREAADQHKRIDKPAGRRNARKDNSYTPLG